MVVGGSTDALTAKAIVYDGDPRHACLACHNPREEDGARLRRLEQEVRGMVPVPCGSRRSRLAWPKGAPWAELSVNARKGDLRPDWKADIDGCSIWSLTATIDIAGAHRHSTR